jgi:hypothetical protein
MCVQFIVGQNLTHAAKLRATTELIIIQLLSYVIWHPVDKCRTGELHSKKRGNPEERPRCAACMATTTQESLPLSSMKERATREGYPLDVTGLSLISVCRW